ncbi:MAG: dihydroorotase, partial [Flavobacterium sp.]
MKLILRQAKIIDARSKFHNQTVDIQIAGSVIEKIGAKLANPGKYEEVTLENLHVSNGWFDSSVSLGEPGFEDRETIASGLQAAAKSGFTGIALQPNCFPVTDNQSQINFLKNKANGFATEVFP